MNTKSKFFPTRFSFVRDVPEIFTQIATAGLLDDRREYAVEDLERMYELTGLQARQLYALIQGATR